MGLGPSNLAVIHKYINLCISSQWQGLKVLELGSQSIYSGHGMNESSGKEYFQNKGICHTSVDLDGQYGALALNLGELSHFQSMNNKYDIVTNIGTTEHVEPLDSQYACFQNIHNCLKVGGIAIHQVPDIFDYHYNQHHKNHCKYFYSEYFFDTLAKHNKYQLICNSKGLLDGTIWSVYRKTSISSFIINKPLFLSTIHQRDCEGKGSGQSIEAAEIYFNHL